MFIKKHIASSLFLVLILLIYGHTKAQYSINGKVKDSTQAEMKTLEGVSVSLLLAADSSLVSFQRVKTDNSFHFINLQSGQYIIMTTHPFYADFVGTTRVENNVTVDIFLTPLSVLLEEVFIKNNRAIRLKGDTTIFIADSFKVDKNASVEELLKRLPGIQANSNGVITTFGETVSRVLVDGEEFFGSDPGIATKNLRADIVQEVQVYDAKSQKSLFTGVDDGTKTKTINLKIKENKKKGYFGKTEVGGGIKNRYYGSATINNFSGNRKTAAYGSISNIGYTAATDISKLNSMSIPGTPTNYNWGGQYTNKFLKNVLILNANYKTAITVTPGENKTRSAIFGNDTSWNSNTTSYYKTRSDNQSVDFSLEFIPSKKDNLTLSSQSAVNNSRSNTVDTVLNTYTDGFDTKKINENSRSSSIKTNRITTSNELRWLHKLKVPTKSVLLNLKHQYSKNNSSDFLNSKLDTYVNNLSDNSIILNQLGKVQLQSNNFTLSGSYIEALTPQFNLELNYTVSYNQNQNNKVTLNRNDAIPEKYDLPVDSLTNNFRYNIFSNTPNIGVQYYKKNIAITARMASSLISYKQINYTKATQRSYSYVNYNPVFSVKYSKNNMNSLSFGYEGKSSAPSLEQLQPTIVNTDPLNLRIGNPGLNPAFLHDFNLNYQSFKTKGFRRLNFFLQYSVAQNFFTNSALIENNITINQTVNTHGVYSYSIGGNYNKPYNNFSFIIGADPRISFRQGINYITQPHKSIQKNKIQNTIFSLSLFMNKNSKKYSLELMPLFEYNLIKSTLNTAANNNFWSVTGTTSFSLNLPKNIKITNTILPVIRQKNDVFPGKNNTILWNAAVSKKLLKESISLTFTTNDLLNQEGQYTRSFNNYIFTESYNQTLKRYFLVGLIWHINKI